MKTVRIIQREKFWLYIGLAAFILMSPGCSLGAKYQRRIHLTQGFDAGQTFKAKIHNGAITVESILDLTDLLTHNGSIDCLQVSGRVHARTHNGPVRIRYDKDNLNPLDTDISTHNGSIDIHTPDDLSALLNISTHNGSINVARPVTVSGRIEKNYLNGRIGSGDGRIFLRTHNGAVTLR